MEEIIRWYGRRHGKKLSARRKDLILKLLPKINLNKKALESDKKKGFSLSSDFKDIWLEIGFGGGEHLANQALRCPEVGFIGCEPFVNGVASLLSKIDHHSLKNVRIYADDARLLLDLMPDQFIGRVFLLFGDPWPKRKHENRRFINKVNLDRVARIMKDGGEFRFASDHIGYTSWALEHFLCHKDFYRTTESSCDWLEPPLDWVETRYENKAKINGSTPIYLNFKRKARL